MNRFCWCHIELPGQSYGSADWSAGTQTDQVETPESAQETTPIAGKQLSKSSNYPTLQELAVDIGYILEKLELLQVVLFGEGAGANLLSRVAIMYDSRVLGAVLIHGRCTPSGPLQLLRDKMRNWRGNTLDPHTVKYLLEHRFSTTVNTNMIGALKNEFDDYKNALSDQINSKNLNLLTYAYAHRTSLAEMIHELKCPILLLSGTKSDHRSGTRHMFESINKAMKGDFKNRINVELIEIDDAISPLIEKPDKVAESVLIFLQGLGIVASRRPSACAELLEQSRKSIAGSPEKRNCSEFTNLDSFIERNPADLSQHGSPVHTLSTATSAGQGEKMSPQHYSRFFNRQMSMAELDLPRGPDALSTIKTGPLSPHRKSQVSGHMYPCSGDTGRSHGTNESVDYSANRCGGACTAGSQSSRQSECVE